MRQSESIDLLAGALSKAQGEFPPIKKTKTAKIPMKSGGSFSYTYADLADIREAVTPILVKYGLSVSQAPTILGETPTLTTTLLHESGQWKESEMLLHVEKSDAQGQGSAITYARRYAISAVLGIVTEEDDDGARASNRDKQLAKTEAAVKKETVQRSAPLRDDQKQIKDGLEMLSADERAEFAVWWGKSGITRGVHNLSPEECQTVYARLFSILNDSGEIVEAEVVEASQVNLGPSEAIVEAFPNAEPVAPSITNPQMGKIRALIGKGEDVNARVSEILKREVLSLSGLSKSEASHVIQSLEK